MKVSRNPTLRFPKPQTKTGRFPVTPMTSDTDRLVVRELYGTTREIGITWSWGPGSRSILVPVPPEARHGVQLAARVRQRGRRHHRLEGRTTSVFVFDHDAFPFSAAERCQYVPFTSTFTDDAPVPEVQQFEQRRFKADRHMSPGRAQSLAQVLMAGRLRRGMMAASIFFPVWQ